MDYRWQLVCPCHRPAQLRRAALLGFLLFVVLWSSALPAAAATNGTITIDTSQPAGTDNEGRMLLFAPAELDAGSSISHWDSSASPNLLMEPSINPDLLFADVDLTRQMFEDEGWSTSGGSEIRLSLGSGFNDPSLGSARRAAARRAADIWQSMLSSSVPINISMQFSDLTCDEEGAVLAQAGPSFVFKVQGAPFANTWYHGPLAEALTGSNLSTGDNPDPNAADISATFNSAIDNDCLGGGSTYYYGDGSAPAGRISFIAVALHEIAHGLGFGNFVNESTGAKLQGSADVYTQFTRDNVRNKSWANMTAAEIRASAVNDGEVVWTGPRVKQRARNVLDPSPVLRLDEPSQAAGRYLVSTAAFGPSVQSSAVSGRLAVVDDGSAQATLGCGALRNGSEISGKIAVVDRGTCLFVEKVKNAQNAGAIGVVVVNNVAGRITMGGSDSSITIPTVMVSLDDGRTIKDAIAADSDPDDPDDPDDPPDDPPPNNDPIQDLPPEDPSVCTPSATALCLAGDPGSLQKRFRVEVEFTDPLGNGGAATGQPLSDDSAYFYFFDPKNVELLIKVLDGCSINQRFWVFGGGLTNVAVEVRVVDTQTGRGRLYKSTQGQAYRPVQDTVAFETCP